MPVSTSMMKGVGSAMAVCCHCERSEDSMGVDSGRPVVWQTEVANPRTLETTDVARPARRTRRYPNPYWRDFHLVGTEPFEMADHFARPRRRAEDVQAFGRGGRPRRPVGSLLGYPGQGLRSD